MNKVIILIEDTNFLYIISKNDAAFAVNFHACVSHIFDDVAGNVHGPGTVILYAVPCVTLSVESKPGHCHIVTGIVEHVGDFAGSLANQRGAIRTGYYTN